MRKSAPSKVKSAVPSMVVAPVQTASWLSTGVPTLETLPPPGAAWNVGAVPTPLEVRTSPELPVATKAGAPVASKVGIWPSVPVDIPVQAKEVAEVKEFKVAVALWAMVKSVPASSVNLKIFGVKVSTQSCPLPATSTSAAACSVKNRTPILLRSKPCPSKAPPNWGVVSSTTLTKFPDAVPVRAPTNVVDVMEVAPVTTPASMLIVPSSNIACPAVGVMARDEAPAEDMALAFKVMSSTVRVPSVPTDVREEASTLAPNTVSDSTLEVSMKYAMASASSMPPSSTVATRASSTWKRYSPLSAVTEAALVLNKT